MRDLRAGITDRQGRPETMKRDCAEVFRRWFRIDRAWAERRNAYMEAWEDEIVRAVRDRASRRDREFMDRLLAERERNKHARP